MVGMGGIDGELANNTVVYTLSVHVLHASPFLLLPICMHEVAGPKAGARSVWGVPCFCP